ncbi:MAG: tyrosine-type recombinase/integrase [Thalassolituus sp.]|jgi:integrase|uniref:tyrosine-type recombinase/integrase n=1 Tax=Thalassolituus sp. TaxID=2030822 RepID=UPI0039820E16
MNISKFKDPDSGRMQFRVYSNDSLPFEHINCFLRHLEFRDLAPNTVKAYAHDLVFFFRYLIQQGINWSDINLDGLVRYVHVLRFSSSSNLASTTTVRSEPTVSRYVAAVFSFYRYHYFNNGLLIDLGDRGIISESGSSSFQNGFLSFAKSARSHSQIKRRPLIKYTKTVKPEPKVIPPDVQFRIIKSCKNLRDKLLISLLLETGMRIGQVLQLKHSDIESWNECLHIKRRLDNPNQVYAKTRNEYTVSLSKEWLDLYTDYIIHDQGDINAEYVFTSLYRKDGGDVTAPLSYQRAKKLLKSIGDEIGFNLTPHMFRHTHATELLKADTPIEIVAKRLGHASIETTRNMYEHLSARDMRKILDSAKGLDKN